MKPTKYMVALMVDGLAASIPPGLFKTFKANSAHDAIHKALKRVNKAAPGLFSDLVYSGKAYAYTAPKVASNLWPATGGPMVVTGHSITFPLSLPESQE